MQIRMIHLLDDFHEKKRILTSQIVVLQVKYDLILCRVIRQPSQFSATTSTLGMVLQPGRWMFARSVSQSSPQYPPIVFRFRLPLPAPADSHRNNEAVVDRDVDNVNAGFFDRSAKS